MKKDFQIYKYYTLSQILNMLNLKTLKSKSFIKFIFFGVVITILSNTSLLFLLLILPISSATFLSQILHAFLGYLSNKYGVFKCKGNPFAYLLLVLISWLIQWLLIKNLVSFGFSYIFSVLVVIPLLATFSFINQKYIVFRK